MQGEYEGVRLLKLLPRILSRGRVELRLLQWAAMRRLRREVTLSTRQGRFTISTAADDPIGRALYSQGEYELGYIEQVFRELEALGAWRSDGTDTILDVGANIGVISIGVLNRGLAARSIAIEPEPRNHDLLRRNARQNGLADRMLCLQRAVSDTASNVEFELSDSNFGDHRVRRGPSAPADDAGDRYGEPSRAVILVEADRIDTLLAAAPAEFTDRIALMWIDVQGFEGYAFEGASRLLESGLPTMAEIWPYGLRRAGMGPERFCAIAERFWSEFRVLRRGRFVRYPIGMLGTFFEELGPDGEFDNVLFLGRAKDTGSV